MKLTIKLDEINYGDVAVRAMPLVTQSADACHGAVGMIVAAASVYLPENLIRSSLDAIPEERKDEIIAQFVMEHNDRILRNVNELSEKYKIGVDLKKLTIDRNLTAVAEIRKLDYICIVDRFLPIIKEKMLNIYPSLTFVFHSSIMFASAKQIVSMLGWFPVGNKETFLASLINQNQQNLISAIEDAAQKQNIRLKINSIILEV